MHKPTLFIHCGIGNDRYALIMDEFFSHLDKSGARDKLDIRVCSVGRKPANELWFNEQYHNDDFGKGEFFTLGILQNFCKEIGVGVPVGYVHTKGVFNGFDNPCIIDWRQYMGYFVLERVHDCLRALEEGNDVVGVDWVTEPNKHFSGNFWWANSQYINRLPKIDPPNFQIEGAPSQRHLAEFWIGYGFPKVKCLHSSKINVYERHLHRYPRSLYEIEGTK